MGVDLFDELDEVDAAGEVSRESKPKAEEDEEEVDEDEVFIVSVLRGNVVYDDVSEQ